MWGSIQQFYSQYGVYVAGLVAVALVLLPVIYGASKTPKKSVFVLIVLCSALNFIDFVVSRTLQGMTEAAVSSALDEITGKVGTVNASIENVRKSLADAGELVKQINDQSSNLKQSLDNTHSAVDELNGKVDSQAKYAKCVEEHQTLVKMANGVDMGSSC